jgi:uncharacterized DUF497 family protein
MKIDFEWDSEKARLIAEKHHVKMEKIWQIFLDPFRLIQYDESHSGYEERWQTLGLVDEVLFVVYTERGEKIRIITAREATPLERRIYYGTSDKGYWVIP